MASKQRKKLDTSEVGFEQFLNSSKWSDVELATIQAIAIQLKAIREGMKVLDAKIAAIAETLPGYESLISFKGIGTLSAATFLVTIGDIKGFHEPGNLAAYFGITPRVSHSNDSQRAGRIAKRGNKLADNTA